MTTPDINRQQAKNSTRKTTAGARSTMGRASRIRMPMSEFLFAVEREGGRRLDAAQDCDARSWLLPGPLQSRNTLSYISAFAPASAFFAALLFCCSPAAARGCCCTRCCYATLNAHRVSFVAYLYTKVCFTNRKEPPYHQSSDLLSLRVAKAFYRNSTGFDFQCPNAVP